MSSLIFCTEQSRALIATDTLMVDESGAGLAFTSKALIVPHLRMAIAGTGIGGFSTRWFSHVNDCMAVRGIDNLNFHTPGNLRRLYAARHAVGSHPPLAPGNGGCPDGGEQPAVRPPFPSWLTTTIYHFGISETTGHIHSYAYRSENNFESESLTYGTRIKPDPGPEHLTGNCELPFGIIEMMQSQRRIQAALPREDRIHIGGEIHVIEIGGGQFWCYRLHRFDDFDLTEQEIYKRLSTRTPSV